MEVEISSVLARTATPVRRPRPPPPPPPRARETTGPTTPPEPNPAHRSAEASPTTPTAAATATAAAVAAVPATVRGFVTWDEAVPVEGEVVRGGSDARAVATSPPVRERGWTVPSPYHAFDKTFMSPRCSGGRRAPVFRLDESAAGGGSDGSGGGGSSGGGGGNTKSRSAVVATGKTATAVGDEASVGVGNGGVIEICKTCSCGSGGGGTTSMVKNVSGCSGPGGNSKAAIIAAGALATREEMIHAWKGCVSCGAAGPIGLVIGGGTATKMGGCGAQEAKTVVSIAAPAATLPAAATAAVEPAAKAKKEAVPSIEAIERVTDEESHAFAEATRAADVDVESAAASADLAAAVLEAGSGRLDSIGRLSNLSGSGSGYGSGSTSGGGTGEDEPYRQGKSADNMAKESRFHIEEECDDGEGVESPDRFIDVPEWRSNSSGRRLNQERSSTLPTSPPPPPPPVMDHTAVQLQDEEEDLASSTVRFKAERQDGPVIRSQEGVTNHGKGPDGVMDDDDRGRDEHVEEVMILYDHEEDGDEVDEWEDDLDPGYRVVAISEEEFLRGDVPMSHADRAVLKSSPVRSREWWHSQCLDFEYSP